MEISSLARPEDSWMVSLGYLGQNVVWSWNENLQQQRDRLARAFKSRGRPHRGLFHSFISAKISQRGHCSFANSLQSHCFDRPTLILTPSEAM